jgi:hypothetical protein
MAAMRRISLRHHVTSSAATERARKAVEWSTSLATTCAPPPGACASTVLPHAAGAFSSPPPPPPPPPPPASILLHTLQSSSLSSTSSFPPPALSQRVQQPHIYKQHRARSDGNIFQVPSQQNFHSKCRAISPLGYHRPSTLQTTASHTITRRRKASAQQCRAIDLSRHASIAAPRAVVLQRLMPAAALLFLAVCIGSGTACESRATASVQATGDDCGDVGVLCDAAMQELEQGAGNPLSGDYGSSD